MNLKRIIFQTSLLALLPASVLATGAVDLGTVSSFAVLAGSAVTNTGPTVITGDLGLHPGTAVSGFPPGLILGSQYIAEAVAEQAKIDLVTAYDDIAGRTPVTTIATELGGAVLTPGVYNSATGTFGITGTLTLDAQNDPDAVFIFQMESTLITASSSIVELIGAADPCNIFWQVGSSATLGTNSSFRGNILALASITLTTGASVEGRTLARNGAVTFDSNVVTRMVCTGGTADTQYIPSSIRLQSAFPNPFNPSITIAYSLEQTEHMRLIVYNSVGQQVAILHDGLAEAGEHTVDFQAAAGLASGVYHCTLTAGDYTRSISFTLLK